MIQEGYQTEKVDSKMFISARIFGVNIVASKLARNLSDERRAGGGGGFCPRVLSLEEATEAAAEA